MTVKKSEQKGARRRKALGRGLSNLIPSEEAGEGNSSSGIDRNVDNGARYVPLDSVNPNPFQPRKEFSETEIADLAQSIKNSGLLQPILVRLKDDSYEIISGERRFRALKSLGKKKIPVIVKENISNRRMVEMALIENVQREDLNEIEKANTYRALLTEHGLSHEEVSQQVGKSRSVITNALRILKLPKDVQQMVIQKQISSGHARALLALENANFQEKIARRIKDEGLSVRFVEKLVSGSAKAQSRIKKKKPKKENEVEAFLKDPDVAGYIDKLQKKFGTSVTVKTRQQERGSLEISFFGKEDLNRILSLLS